MKKGMPLPAYVLGSGRYQLSDVYDETGVSLPLSTLSIKRQRQLLSAPTGDADYIAKTALLRSNFAARDFLSQFNSLYDHFSKLKFPSCRELDMRVQGNKSIAYLNLDDFDHLVRGSKFNPAPFWVRLEHQKSFLCVLLINDKNVSVYSDQELMIAGQIDIGILTVYSTKKIYITQRLKINEVCRFYAKEVEINSGSTVSSSSSLLTTQLLDIFALNQCLLVDMI